ncbi:MAG: hypothetical protein UY70_C0008G0038 [Candidatus Kaiserbacteria bacterium GW2011_GWB1_52_6]|uniref:Asparagine synthetase domain-containing protein n=3 Tax=Candidatus Kaiseribacteriota TaxID=1752734 RepID=A0A0G1XL70_9BACT|nr:MAG: hypothetical protein UY67_C0001G0008 [Candidatus Kaiserbacteria bacterium GW2011_GWA2_52_12]KKW27759.1 MAG: hypothetical protein UY70_C0008G0038 [Candidatus Kaiserbacteria bacterium GW2011_GWB1_52_6]KKW32033.1 MAG: hypothetical protein UY74_C0001G0006 [Candidatus Kaiserbacteria bacterium GW2011_GWC2_52_8b]
MSDHLVYYDCNIVPHKINAALAGIRTFSYFFKMYGTGVLFVDRTETIRTPVRVKSLFPMPAFRPIKKTYGEICDERAKELLTRAEKMGVTIYVFWSGGIDSTCVLVSLFKNATPEQKKNIVVILSEESITEYPDFYRDHIHGKIRVEPGIMAPYFLFGGNHLIVNGESNDQLFGSDMCGKFINMYGESVIQATYNRDTFFSTWNALTGDGAITNFYIDMFEKLAAVAPIPLITNHDRLWWINFCLKWQLVHMFILSYAGPRNIKKITPEYFGTHYAPFFATEEFQLWSMNNLDKRIKGTWKSYKWIVKDFIYEYTKDAEYRDNKIKHASRYFLLLYQRPYTQITEDMGAEGFKRDHSLAAYHDPVNDFI